MKNVYTGYLENRTAGSPLVIATVVRTLGSTPQKPGSSALISGSGLVSGTVGGGVVEGKVVRAASEAIISRCSGIFSYQLTNDISVKDDAICGGVITILADANPDNHLQVFKDLRNSMESRIPGILITMVTPFSQKACLVNRYWLTRDSKPSLPPEFMIEIGPAVAAMLESGDTSGFREMELSVPGEEPSSLFFLEAVFPLPRLVIAGAGHIGKALAHLGSRLGFEVTIIDDRTDFANRNNIPEADRIISGEVGRAMASIEKSDDTYIVIVTRGHKDDAEALKSCINARTAYKGMIGSKKKIAAMRAEFIGNGWATSEQWESLHAPVGLDIGSQTVEEIAVSIAAQLIHVRSGRKLKTSDKH